MKRILVGQYRLGLRNVRVFINPEDSNGSVYVHPKDNGSAKITVGAESSWGTVFGIFLHEVYELTLIDLNVRYKKDPSFSNQSSDYIFFLSHNELNEAHERIGEFLADAIPDFQAVYKKLKKKPK